ncbi:MAG: hypothetical protein KAQ83_04580 [Nanoarchaeota archaeon]|nr:hypothetical protein [Nanoarchaeota archaeon]
MKKLILPIIILSLIIILANNANAVDEQTETPVPELYGDTEAEPVNDTELVEVEINDLSWIWKVFVILGLMGVTYWLLTKK